MRSLQKQKTTEPAQNVLKLCVDMDHCLLADIAPWHFQQPENQ